MVDGSAHPAADGIGRGRDPVWGPAVSGHVAANATPEAWLYSLKY